MPLRANDAEMIPPDIALAALINRTAAAYTANAPVYISYTEHTSVSAPSLGRAQEIDRSVVVRQADDYAIMQDLPRGAQRIGQAFPIVPYFDPFGGFMFSYYANLKRVDITLKRDVPQPWPIPAVNPNANMTVPYASFWTPAYRADSTANRLDIQIKPTSLYGAGFYPYRVLEDPQTQLPAEIAMRTTDDSERITLDYGVIGGHWMITRGTFTSNEHFGLLNFQVVAQTVYLDITFPAVAPDPRLLQTPAAPSPGR